MKLENILLLGAVGAAIYFLLRPKASPRPMSESIASGYFPGMKSPVMGAPTCPPGYYLENINGTLVCSPIKKTGPGAALFPVPPSGITVKASEDVVWDNGRLVPISEVFK